MDDFDQAARFIVKADAVGHIRWLFPGLADRMQVLRWLDAQSAPRPGEPDRRCDTIAEVVDRTGQTEPCAIVVELFTSPDPEAVVRTLEYLGRFARELRHGPHGNDWYNLSAGMTFLTSAPEIVELRSSLPDEQQTLLFAPHLRIVSAEVAVATLQAFEDNRCGWGILAWCSLIQGGQDLEFVARWRGVVERLSDLGVQRILVDIVQVFAQLTDSGPIWKKGLEDMLITESILMREQRDIGAAQGALKARREDLLAILEARFTVPSQVREHIEQQTDLQLLARWLTLAATQPDIDAFRSAIGL